MSMYTGFIAQFVDLWMRKLKCKHQKKPHMMLLERAKKRVNKMLTVFHKDQYEVLFHLLYTEIISMLCRYSY